MINERKTKYTTVHCQAQKVPLCLPNFLINYNVHLDRVFQLKFLGLAVDSCLNLWHHVAFIIHKISKYVPILYAQGIPNRIFCFKFILGLSYQIYIIVLVYGELRTATFWNLYNQCFITCLNRVSIMMYPCAVWWASYTKITTRNKIS